MVGTDHHCVDRPQFRQSRSWQGNVRKLWLVTGEEAVLDNYAVTVKVHMDFQIHPPTRNEEEKVVNNNIGGQLPWGLDHPTKGVKGPKGPLHEQKADMRLCLTVAGKEATCGWCKTGAAILC